jgi:hypothetical protein
VREARAAHQRAEDDVLDPGGGEGVGRRDALRLLGGLGRHGVAGVVRKVVGREERAVCAGEGGNIGRRVVQVAFVQACAERRDGYS